MPDYGPSTGVPEANVDLIRGDSTLVCSDMTSRTEDVVVKFMLMMHAPRGTGDWDVAKWKPEDVRAMVKFMGDLNRDLTSRGELVSAEGLVAPGEARIVRAGKDGKPVVTDGPFAETKEFLAGFWIVECPTAERAYDIAARASSAPGPAGAPMNIPIEVRAVGAAPEV
jgi:hypothetical protein